MKLIIICATVPRVHPADNFGANANQWPESQRQCPEERFDADYRKNTGLRGQPCLTPRSTLKKLKCDHY